MTWSVAIPSYKRPEGVLKKTIKTLKEYKVPSDRILVFVNSEQVEEYKNVIGSEAKVVNRGDCKSVSEARNFIIDYFPKGKEFVFMDDDISGFKEVKGGKLVDLPSLVSTINHGFDLCKKHSCHLWGLYPACNAFYMKPKEEYTTDLKFIVGAFMGIINQKIFVNPKYGKEDYLLSIEYFKRDGAVIRFNHIGVRYGIGQKGGVGTEAKERLINQKANADFLIKTYPEYVSLNPRRPGEVLLKRGLKGGAVPKIREDADKDNTERLTYPIRNKARYDKAKAELLEALKTISVPQLGKPAQNGHHNRAQKLGSIGRTMTFGFGDTRRGIKEFATNRDYPDVLRALAHFGNCVVPSGWTYNAITLNHGVKANKHKDTRNLGPSVIIGIGDFTGGDIKVWDKDDKDPKVFNLHDKPVMFNGGLLYHQTTPFKGDRYTMVFYKQMWEGEVKGVKMRGSGEMVETGGIFA